MISHVAGTVAEAEPGRIVLDVHGVGYEILVPPSPANVPPPGTELKLFTYLNVREDSHTLFGFASADERKLFRLISTVKGIGPKIALSILGHLTASSFATAVSNANTKILSSIPGLGKKTAERLIVELKDRIVAVASWSSGDRPPGPDTVQNDAVAALLALGYKQADALQRVQAARSMLGKEAKLDDLVKASLAG